MNMTIENSMLEGGAKEEPIAASEGQLLPTNKLESSHGVFMASINSSSSPKMADRLANSTLIVGNGSSTKVIESLHEQLDTLTNTNLQLTVQSHSLLDKLENAQQRETKLQENISSLKHENENLNSMLNRKTRKLKGLEIDFETIREKFNQLSKEKNELYTSFTMVNKQEAIMKNEMAMIQNQYDTIADSHEYYKEKYTLEISTLQKQLDGLKQNQVDFIKFNNEQNKILNEKVGTFGNEVDNLKEVNESFNNLLSTKCEDAINELDLLNWAELYKDSKILAIEYSKEMNIELSSEFKDMARNKTYETLESRGTSRNQNNLNNNSSVQNKNHDEPIRMVKLRTVSPNTMNNNLGSPHINKRSSYYGGSKTTFTSNSSSPGTLPGVKRSSSIRNSNSRIPSTNMDTSKSNSPRLTSHGFSNSNNNNNGTLNTNSLNVRVSSGSNNASNRKKKNSMMI